MPFQDGLHSIVDAAVPALSSLKPINGSTAHACFLCQLALREPKQETRSPQKFPGCPHARDIDCAALASPLLVNNLGCWSVNLGQWYKFFWISRILLRMCRCRGQPSGADSCVQVSELRMAIFVFAGSKGGSARTVSSILLAAGLRELGFSPVHAQLVPDGMPSTLGRIEGLPFAVFWTRSGDGKMVEAVLEASSHCGASHSHLILDNPAQPIRKVLTYAAGIGARILLPMRDGVQEIGRVLHDLREIQEAASASEEPLPKI